MKKSQLPRSPIFICVVMISVYTVSITVSAHGVSRQTQVLIDRLLSVDKYEGQEHIYPRVELARLIAKDKTIPAKNQVNALTTVLREELENPCPNPGPIYGAYGPPTIYIRKQYVFALVNVGNEALPYLRQHLEQLKLAVQNLSPSLSNQQSVATAEIQHCLISLGLLGDKEVFPEVLKLLEIDDGYVRQMAAGALANLKNKAAIRALKRALTDDFHHHDHSCMVVGSSNPDFYLVYPVRQAAAFALKKFGFKIVRDGNDFRIVN